MSDDAPPPPPAAPPRFEGARLDYAGTMTYGDYLHLDEVLGAVHGAGYSILDLTMREADLEDIFISLTSRK